MNNSVSTSSFGEGGAIKHFISKLSPHLWIRSLRSQASHREWVESRHSTTVPSGRGELATEETPVGLQMLNEGKEG